MYYISLVALFWLLVWLTFSDLQRERSKELFVMRYHGIIWMEVLEIKHSRRVVNASLDVTRERIRR